MRLLKEALGLLGTLMVLAVIVAFVAPKRARAVAAALVQIVPGTTTHVGQNESQLVSLTCQSGNDFCNAVDPGGNVSTSKYVVPTGYTLIVTDWEFFPFGTPNNTSVDALQVPSVLLLQNLVIGVGSDGVLTHEHYATGVRAGSGMQIEDAVARSQSGIAQVQGYLVPND